MTTPAPPDPDYRITTFGLLTIERLSLPRSSPARYTVLSDDIWHKRYQGKKLLKALLCCDYRQASKDVLMEQLWPEAEPENASHSLDEAARQLRAVLSFPESGRSLLHTLRADQATIYTLPAQERLWVDVDAVQQLYQRARRGARAGGGEDPLPLLEEALELARGEFLLEDLYAPWTQQQRQVVTGLRHRCCTWLLDLYRRREMVGEQEELLQRLLKHDPGDEELLYRLMELLAQQSRPEEALEVYERFRRVLEREQEGEPAARTQALARQLRAGMLVLDGLSTGTATETETASPGQAEQAVQTGQSGLLSRSPEPGGERLLVWPLSVEQRAGPAAAGSTGLGIQLVHIIELVTHWKGEGRYDELQAVIHQEIHMFDAMKPQQITEDYTISRRQALIAIAALPTALLIAVCQRQESALVVREFLARCAASIAACRHLINGQELGAVEQVLPHYVPTLKTLAQRSSPHQAAAARLVVQADQLSAILALHSQNLGAMEYYGREAMQYSLLTGDRDFYIAMLRQVAAALHYQKRSKEVIEIYEEVLPSLPEMLPPLRGTVCAGLAWAYGHSKQEQESLRYLGLAYEAFASRDEAAQGFLDMSIDNLYMYEGYTHLALHEHYPERQHAHEAWKAFARVSDASSMPGVAERIRLEAINHLALTTLATGDLEQFCRFLEAGITGARALGSQKRRQEAIDAYWKGRQLWPNEARVRELADLFVN